MDDLKRRHPIDGIGSEPAASGKNPELQDGVEVTCFSEPSDDGVLHFQIIRLQKQIYVWIGCNDSSKLGHLYATAPPARSYTSVGVTTLIGGCADNTGMNIARRLVLKTGLSIVLACNLPKNAPMFEVNAEKKLVHKLIELGYVKPRQLT